MSTQAQRRVVRLEKGEVTAAIAKFDAAHREEMQKKSDATPTTPSDKVVENRR